MALLPVNLLRFWRVRLRRFFSQPFGGDCVGGKNFFRQKWRDKRRMCGGRHGVNAICNASQGLEKSDVWENCRFVCGGFRQSQKTSAVFAASCGSLADWLFRAGGVCLSFRGGRQQKLLSASPIKPFRPKLYTGFFKAVSGQFRSGFRADLGRIRGGTNRPEIKSRTR